MPCTTLLVGKHATYDGSTFMARNEDASSGKYTPKKFIYVSPEEQPRHYQSKLSSFSVDLPDDPMGYTAVPNANGKDGVWGEAGINEAHVAMTETETITSNARVLGADPLVPDGIGEEDMLTLVLPYIHSAREGVLLLGSILEQNGTYEMNGIGFQDADEVWWLETIGGHHWIAKRVPDDQYVVMPNQQGIYYFDFVDAFTTRKDHLCSADMIDFVKDNHLDLSNPFFEGDEDETALAPIEQRHNFDTRAAFGSHDDADYTYNTCRAWYILRYFNRNSGMFDEMPPDYDYLPWSAVPDRKITIEDVKYALSNHYQRTPYDPYNRHGDLSYRGQFRAAGINRTNFLSLTQIRPDGLPIKWVTMGCNVYNAFVPFYTDIDTTPAYFANTTDTVSTDSFYWQNRLIAALADPHHRDCASLIERYQHAVHNKGMALLHQFDAKVKEDGATLPYLDACNEQMAQMVKAETDQLLANVLYVASEHMKNAFARSDA